MRGAIAESTIEEAAPSWLNELGYAVLHWPEIAQGELGEAKNRTNRTDGTNGESSNEGKPCRINQTRQAPV